MTIKMKPKYWHILFGISIILSVILAGCGNKESQNTSNKQAPAIASDGKTQTAEETVYIPEYVILPEYDFINRAIFYNDYIYFAAADYLQYGSFEWAQKGLYKIDQDSTVPEQLDVPLEPGAKIQAMTTDREGNLYLVLGNDNTIKEVDGDIFIRILKLNSSGQSAGTFDVTSAFNHLTFKFISFISVDQNGNILLVSENSKEIVAFSQEGTFLSRTEASGLIMTLQEGRGKTLVGFLSGSGVDVAEFDSRRQTFGQTYKKVGKIGNFSIAGESENGFLINSGGIVYEYNIQTGQQQKIFDWLSCDLNDGEISCVKQLEDGRFWALNNSYGRLESVFLRKAQPGEDIYAGKEFLTVYMMYAFSDPSIEYEIVRFNKVSQDYRFELIMDNEQFADSVERLNLDMIAGGGPDIIIFPLTGSLYDYSSKQFSMETYAQKGALENLYEYLDADPEINREDYLENILKAFETDGKLCVLPLSFQIDTIFTRSSVSSAKNGWTLDEMMNYISAQPENREFIGGVPASGSAPFFNLSSQKELLNICLRANMDQLLREENGQYVFDIELMQELLKFSNQMPVYEQPPTAYLPPGEVDILQDLWFSSPGAYIALNTHMQEPLTITGYPGAEGSESFAASRMAVGINANCRNKDVAWEFLRTFLLEERQNHCPGWGMPIHKNAFEKNIENDIEYLKTNYSVSDEEARQQMNAAREMIAGITTMTLDTPAHAIIREEAEYYFQGGKSAEEVTDIIANRVLLYMNEMDSSPPGLSPR